MTDGGLRKTKQRKSDVALKDEPNNWIGLGLILMVVAVVALVLFWLRVPPGTPA